MEKFKNLEAVSQTTKVEMYFALHKAAKNCSQQELELLFELSNDPGVQSYLNLFLAKKSMGKGGDRSH